MLWGNGSISTTTTDEYLDPGYNQAIAPISATTWAITAPGELQHMWVRHNDVAATAGNIVYDVLVNGVAAGLTVTLAANAALGSELVTTVAVAAGDLVSLRARKPVALANAPSRIVVSVGYIAA